MMLHPILFASSIQFKYYIGASNTDENCRLSYIRTYIEEREVKKNPFFLSPFGSLGPRRRELGNIKIYRGLYVGPSAHPRNIYTATYIFEALCTDPSNTPSNIIYTIQQGYLFTYIFSRSMSNLFKNIYIEREISLYFTVCCIIIYRLVSQQTLKSLPAKLI